MKRAEDMVARVNENVERRKETTTNKEEPHKPEKSDTYKITSEPGDCKKVIKRITPPQNDEPLNAPEPPPSSRPSVKSTDD